MRRIEIFQTKMIRENLKAPAGTWKAKQALKQLKLLTIKFWKVRKICQITQVHQITQSSQKKLLLKWRPELNLNWILQLYGSIS